MKRIALAALVLNYWALLPSTAHSQASCDLGKPAAGAPEEFAQEQEQENTRLINKLYERASALNDHATISHLQWFVDEQVEEEKTVGEIVSLVERAGSDVSAILYLNDKVGAGLPKEMAHKSSVERIFGTAHQVYATTAGDAQAMRRAANAFRE